MHETLVSLARRQHGVVSTAQLLGAGFDDSAIARLVANGWLRRLHRGVYLVGALESELTRPAAALLATGPEAALSHRTAATIWELLPPRPADPIHITLLNANRRSRHGVEIHRATRLETMRRYGLVVTSPAQTLQQLRGADYEHARNEALIRRKAGLPRPRTNVKVRGYEVDMHWPEQRLVVEFDGWAYHSTRAAFERDRLRDAELQLAGERVLRVTHRQLAVPERLVARFAAALATERLIARLAVALAGGLSNIRPVGGPLVN